MGLYQFYTVIGMIFGALLLIGACFIRKRWRKVCAVLTVIGFLLILAGMDLSLLIQTGIIQEPLWSFAVVYTQ